MDQPGTADRSRVLEPRDKPWWAVVGIEPQPTAGGVSVTAHDKTRRLSEPVEVGPVAIRPGGREFVSYRRNNPYSLDGWYCHQSWPVIVEGTSDLEYGIEFDERASAQVRRVAALVSLAWGEPWQVQSSPRRRSSMRPRIPESDDPPLVSSEPLRLDPVDTSLPGWVRPAWGHLEDDTDARSALIAWHEGFLVEPLHPSLALVAYTASVEALAKTAWARDVVLTDHRSSCTECGRSFGRHRERVRQMVQHVTSEDELDVLEPWYTRRNATVHDANVHGVEISAGSLFDLGPNMEVPYEGAVTGVEVQRFSLQLAPMARGAAGRLLIRFLRRRAADRS